MNKKGITFSVASLVLVIPFYWVVYFVTLLEGSSLTLTIAVWTIGLMGFVPVLCFFLWLLGLGVISNKIYLTPLIAIGVLVLSVIWEVYGGL